MVYSPSNGRIMYVEYMRGKDEPFCYDERKWYSINNTLDELAKKVTLIRYFQNMLDKTLANRTEKTVDQEDIEMDDGQDILTKERSFVKKYIKTKHGMFFWLSDRTVQVSFDDQTVMVVSDVGKAVTFTNRERDTKSYKLSVHHLILCQISRKDCCIQET
jgi:hypothetical protein